MTESSVYSTPPLGLLAAHTYNHLYRVYDDVAVDEDDDDWLTTFASISKLKTDALRVPSLWPRDKKTNYDDDEAKKPLDISIRNQDMSFHNFLPGLYWYFSVFTVYLSYFFFSFHSVPFAILFTASCQMLKSRAVEISLLHHSQIAFRRTHTKVFFPAEKSRNEAATGRPFTTPVHSCKVGNWLNRPCGGGN